MKTIRSVWARLLGVLNRGSRETAMREELEHHIDCLAQESIDKGMPPELARQEARRSFGHAEGVREACREESRWVGLELFGRDVLFAFRALRRMRGGAVVIIVTLGLALGVMGIVADVTRQVMFPKVGLAAPEGLCAVRLGFEKLPNSYMPTIRLVYEQLRQTTEWFSSVTAHGHVVLNMQIDGKPYPMQVTPVSPTFRTCLGLQIGQGRYFTTEEAEQGDAGVAIVSEYVWRHQLGGSPDVVGSSYRIGDRLRRVVGVFTV